MKTLLAALGGGLWLAAWAAGLGTLGILGLRWQTGDHYLPGRLAGYFMPWLLLLLLPGLLAALVTHRRGLTLAIGLPMLLIVLAYAPLFWPWPGKVEADAPALKVMTFNVWSENRQVEAMARIIRQERPDILLLQEIRSRRFDELHRALAGLHEEGSLFFAYDPELLQAVVSRYPVVPLESLRHRGQAQKVAVQLPSATVTVINVHPLRNGGWQRRYRQIAALLEEEIVAEPGAVILAGDFNINDQTQLYRRLTSHLHDAHWEAGFGFGFTYPSREAKQFRSLPLPPLIRIDHIFINSHWIARNTRTLAESAGSDHFPVVAELVLRQD